MLDFMLVFQAVSMPSVASNGHLPCRLFFSYSAYVGSVFIRTLLGSGAEIDLKESCESQVRAPGDVPPTREGA